MGLMGDIDFFDVVAVLNTEAAVRLGVAGTRGVVLGGSEAADGWMYAVHVGEETVMLGQADLVRTGETVERESIYGGETVRVPPQPY
ncbi:hypothetical protein [Embleya sp. AB8]|uniref:hypothetical protein n=1 Tax=Embleya sp. AB8 TaxID=3156304 RepID=UPI003C74DE6C